MVRADSKARPRVEGCAQTIDEYEIAFDVWSCGNGCAAADLISAHGTGRRAWGVLYRTSQNGLQRLPFVDHQHRRLFLRRRFWKGVT
jgi:hypothetical protein